MQEISGSLRKMAKIINGKKIAGKKEKELAEKVAKFRKKTGVVPKLVAIMMGEDLASKLYLGVKKKAAKRTGILFEEKKFAVDVGAKKVIKFIKTADQDSSVHGIMIQLPLPSGLKIENCKLKILGSIDSRKDVDCLTPENLGLLMMGKPRFLPATIKAVLEIIEYGFSRGCNRCQPPRLTRSKPREFRFWRGREIVVVGAGRVVGLPLAVHLENLGATVTVCDEFTKNLAEHTQKAEILISATGVSNLIKKDMVRKGAIVVDVGSPRGEVDFREVKKVAAAITPVPGGVGPLTVVSLLENVLLAASFES